MATAARFLSAATRPFQHFGQIRDFATTAGVEFVVLACTLLSLRLAAVYWGPTGFGEYVIFRRDIGLLQLPLSLSVALGITRYVAIARTTGKSERAYAIAAALACLTTLVMALVVTLLAPAMMADLLFGSPSYVTLLRSLLLAVAGLVMHSVAYGVFRGRLDMRSANALQFANIAIVPLIVLSIPHRTVAQVGAAIGGAWLLVALTSLALGQRRATGSVTRSEVVGALRELLGYGLPRVPGEFALSALFAVPVTMMAHRVGVAEAGYLGFGISLVTMIASVFTPLGLIMLPSTSALIARNDVSDLRQNAFRITAICVCGAAVAVAAIVALAPFIVARGLGSAFVAAVPLVRLVVLAAIPYVSYIVLRNVLDAAHARPFNAKNLLIGLSVVWGAGLVDGRPAVMPLAVLAGTTVIGALTALDSWRILGRLQDITRA